ncbi:trigger factor [Phycisphaeraceae bacterium D3-23]
MADETATETEEQAVSYDVKIEDAGPACKALTITIPADRIKDKIEESYGTLQTDAVLPGFRRGRAPRRLLEKRFASSIGDDVKNQLLSESYSKALEDHELDVLGDPEIEGVEDLKLPEDGDLTYTVKVEVTPDVELPAFDTLKLNKTVVNVTDDEVKEELQRVRDQAGTPTTVEDQPIEEGDYAMVDTLILAGEDAGKDADTLAHYPAAHVLVHGKDKDFKGHVAGILIENLGKEMMGKKVGDVVTISMTGPSSHEDEKIKDQPITVKMDITAIHRIEPAPIEDLLERMGLGSEEELTERVKASLEQRAEQNQKADLYQQACDQLVEKVELDLPAGISSRQTERVLQRQQMDMMYRGTPATEIDEKIAELRTESEDAAQRQLKQFFILDKASKDLDVDVDEQELNGRIAMMAMQSGRRPEKVRQEMMQQGQIEQLYLQIREQKTLDKIIDQATVTEVEGEGDDKPAAKKKSTKKKTSKKKAAAKKDDDAE